MCQYKCPVCFQTWEIFDSYSLRCLLWGCISILPTVSTNYYQQLSKVTALVTSIVHKKQCNMINVRGLVLFYAFFSFWQLPHSKGVFKYHNHSVLTFCRPLQSLSHSIITHFKLFYVIHYIFISFNT